MKSKTAIVYYGGFIHRGGGAYMHVQMFTKVLKSKGWAVSTVTLDNLPIILRYLPHIVEKFANYFYLPLGFIWKARLTKLFYKLLFSKTVDLCVFEDIYLAWTTKNNSVTVLHAVWSDNLQAYKITSKRKAALMAEEVRLINSISHPVVTVSQPYLDYLEKTHFEGQLSKSIQVVELGVDQTIFQQTGQPERCARSIIYCGALEARKNVMFLLKVFERLYEIDNHYELTIVGDGPERSLLTDFTKSNELPVAFLGRLENQSVINELYRHEIYMHTSVKESFSFSLLEAKLAGLKTCAYGGLDVPTEFIDAKMDRFVIEDWVEGIRLLSDVKLDFDASRFTSERMVAATLALVERAG